MRPNADAGGRGNIKVLVNLCWMVPGVVGGSEESVTDALRSVVAQRAEDVELCLAVLEPFLEAHPDLAEAVECEVLPLDGHSKVRRILAEQFWLARTARRIGAQVVHHAGGVVPLWHPGRVVLTIHDLQPLDMPENFALVKRLYLRMMLGRSARTSQVVTVPSEFSRRRVIDLLGIDPGRVVEVPWSIHGTSSAGTRSIDGNSNVPRGDDSDSTPAGRPDVSGDGGSKGFLLYPAIAYTHKRHLLLIEAFAQISSSHPDVDLVLSGGPGPMTEIVRERITELGLDQRVRVVGRVSVEELDALYAGATAVVIPSEYEGFGLPALEAMARGCPVLVSNSGSLSEVVPAESLVASDSTSTWASAMDHVISMTATERDDRISRGRSAAARFSPARTGQALLSAYRLALPGKARFGNSYFEGS